MNIKSILSHGGYEVLEEIIVSNGIADWTHKYVVKYTLKKIEELIADIKKTGGSCDYNLDEIWTIIVTGSGFNGKGNLWMSIAREENTDECWDLIEFEE